MRIDAVTVCVGEMYAELLRRTLPAWLDTLDSLIVVDSGVSSGVETVAPGIASRILSRCVGRRAPTIKVVGTDALTRNGAHFNKGAALNEGIAAAKPTDWILAFDCDIMPPANWREIAEPCLERGNLYGAARYQDGKRCDRHFYPRGYFQLWNIEDQHHETTDFRYKRSMVFEDHHAHAGRYDTAFANRWPRVKQVELPISLEHLGQKSTYWFGPGTTREQMREAQREARTGIACK